MAWKDPEKQREAIRKHYYANRDMYIKKAMLRKKAIKEWLNQYKESKLCADCGLQYPYYVMDFDHLHSKESNISALINSCSMTKIRAEIDKCEVVCANCHRKRTYSRLTANNGMPE